MSAFWLAACGQCSACQQAKGGQCLSPIRVEACANKSVVSAVRLDDDYMGIASVVPTAPSDPLLKQLGAEASWLLLCVLRRYVFASTPPPGSVERGLLQFCLNFVGEYVPGYLERVYWLEQEHKTLQQQQQKNPGSAPLAPPPVKLYLRSFLVASSIFLEDLAAVVKKHGTTARTAMSVLDGLLGCINKRRVVSVFSVGSNNESQIRAAKVNKVKMLYSARMQIHFGEVAWQGNLWIQSLVRSLSPLIVNTLDSYCNPYSLAVIFNRMLDLLLEHTREQAGPEVSKLVTNRDKVTNRPDQVNQIKFNKIGLDVAEERLSKEYGALINSITTSILDMIEVSGFFAVLTAVAKPLRTLFEKSIGSALSVALETSVEDDLKKVRFAMEMLFGEKVADSSSVHASMSADSFASGGEAVEGENTKGEKIARFKKKNSDLLSSVFDNLPALADVGPQLRFEKDESARQDFLNVFYDTTFAAKLEELILLQLSRKSSTIARMSGDYVRNMLRSLRDSLFLVFRSEELLQLLMYDYILPQMI